MKGGIRYIKLVPTSLLELGKNMQFARLYSSAVDINLGVLCAQVITLSNKKSQAKYPAKIRRIKYRDADTAKLYIFLANDFNSPAPTIAILYKNRWQVELFFRWIKQHLKIKSFWGTGENAVKTQIWITLSACLLMTIVKKTLKVKLNLYQMLQIIAVSLFDKKPLL